MSVYRAKYILLGFLVLQYRPFALQQFQTVLTRIFPELLPRVQRRQEWIARGPSRGRFLIKLVGGNIYRNSLHFSKHESLRESHV